MLVLSRNIDQTIVIDDDITVKILGINGTQVRVGIDAPKDISVHREEIYQRIQSKQHHKPEQPSQPTEKER